MEKMVVTVAVTGSQTSKKQNPAVPMTPDEIAEETYRSYNAGAAVVHLHARDPRTDLSDADVLCEIMTKVKSKCNIITQVGTGTRDRFGNPRNFDERLALMDVQPRPDMETINAGSHNSVNLSRNAPPGSAGRSWVSQNPPDLIDKYAKGLTERGIGIEFEIWGVGDVREMYRLIEREILPNKPLNYNFVMGVPCNIPATPKMLLYLVETLPPGNHHFCVMGIGVNQFPMTTMGIILGGGARVGMEDNMYLSKGVLAKSNADLVEKVIRIGRDLGREPATVEEARKILNLD
jgi:3-keto-5-aminohexanoate cleavage enzyme